jgi:mono/diheme cytochrome c family protein
MVTHMHFRRSLLVPFFTATALFLVVGCEDSGNMRDTPRYEPLEPSTVFADGTSARPPVPGTISREDWVDQAPFHTGLEQGELVTRAPIELSADLFARGRDRFNIYCSACHGYGGSGEGMVVARGFTAPASFHIDRLRQAPDGYFFNVITNGFGRMPSYAAQVSAADRWAIIAYIRGLQWSQHAPVADLPPAVREQLEQISP